MAEKYNGWTNYETWCVNLWLTNEQGDYDYWNEAAREAWDDATAEGVITRSDRARYKLADRLKEELTDAAPEGVGGTMYGDLLGAALSEVDWGSIADHFLVDVADTPDDDDAEAEVYQRQD